MAEFFSDYGLFLAKSITVVIAFAAIVIISVGASRRQKSQGHLEITKLNDRFEEMEMVLKHSLMDKKEFKKLSKEEKAKAKKEKKEKPKEDAPAKKRLFVIDFKGDIKATAVSSLREEITAILTIANKEDEILVKLENPGGLVHEHGLAASQLKRIKDRQIPLTVVVDKVAASGGYMMACIADKIVAAPFAVLGSIGVLAQIPNFHRLLDQHGIDFEQVKAGDLKRTLTMFGENTDADRERMKEQIEDTHTLFKDFVAENRPSLDIEAVATGEHWHGIRAIKNNLVDELKTSDDYLLEAKNDADIYEIGYKTKKDLGEKIAAVMESSVLGLASRINSFWR